MNADIEYGVASSTLPGERCSGDCHIVKSYPGGALIAVMDGLGHGEEAAKAARIAYEFLEAHARESAVRLVQGCHDALLKTRGVAMSLAAFDFERHCMTWLGVGNVLGVFLKGDPAVSPACESLLVRGGVVGYRMPALRPASIPLGSGDLLAFATDGVDSRFSSHLQRNAAPQELAEKLLAQFGRPSDDALVLVSRYREGGAVPRG